MRAKSTLITCLLSLLTVGCASNLWISDPIERLTILFGEEPIVPTRGTQIYRYFISVGEGTPAMARIESSSAGTFIVAKGAGRSSRRLVETRRELTSQEWEQFLLKVYETEYWLSDSHQEYRYAISELPRELGLDVQRPASLQPVTYADGNLIYILEASNGDIYHVGSTWVAREGAVYELGEMMMELSGLWEQLEED